jgi:RNA polymerase sigma factor (sigma-70 family)
MEPASATRTYTCVVVDPTDQSDLQLWLAAQGGDASAFGDLFTRHAERVYNYCFRRTGSWAVADDATSQTFAEAWRKRDAVDVGASLLPWLFVVANNVCLNLTRSQRRYARLLAAVPHPPAVVDHADEVAGRIDAERQMQPVLAAMRTLKQADRDVIALCDWEGLSYLDTAAALGIAVGTVRSRLSRARQRLRDTFTDAGPPLNVDVHPAINEARGDLS